jgi:hypothetical protein
MPVLLSYVIFRPHFTTKLMNQPVQSLAEKLTMSFFLASETKKLLFGLTLQLYEELQNLIGEGEVRLFYASYAALFACQPERISCTSAETMREAKLGSRICIWAK